MSKKGGPGIPWQPRWNSGKTTLIRVPIALKDDILAYARAVDSKLTGQRASYHALTTWGFLQEFTLELIQRYIEFKRDNYHPNQNSRQLDINTRAWDELRKFQKLLRESLALLKE